MSNKLPALTVSHHRIDNPDSIIWNLTPLVYRGGTDKVIQKISHLDRLANLPIKHYQIGIILSFKEHAELLLGTGVSVRTVATLLRHIKTLFVFLDNKGFQLGSVDNIRHALFEYSEYQFERANLKQIKHISAYQSLLCISRFLNEALQGLEFRIEHTRLKKERNSRTALGRTAEKLLFRDASKLANFCFEVTRSFKPSSLTLGQIPILLEINSQTINLTSARKNMLKVSSDFTTTQAYIAFNYRVMCEVMIFLAMTLQNQSPTYNLRRTKFDYKALGEKYEVREYKGRRGGEILFKIPKQYKSSFESYLSFINEFAPNSKWLFPHLLKGQGFSKRSEMHTNKLKALCLRYDIPWVPPSTFRKIGLNILMRLSSDSQTAADYGNHAIATFRGSYELPSQQRAMIEIGRFWEESDPLIHGYPTISLFNSPCNGEPLPTGELTNVLPKPDCITPTGCISCKHYRDEDSFDYVWNLLSFKYLKIIESSSHRTKDEKVSNIVIDWINLKINWFSKSHKEERKLWVSESKLRIEEAYYHPNWARKIEKFEG